MCWHALLRDRYCVDVVSETGKNHNFLLSPSFFLHSSLYCSSWEDCTTSAPPQPATRTISSSKTKRTPTATGGGRGQLAANDSRPGGHSSSTDSTPVGPGDPKSGPPCRDRAAATVRPLSSSSAAIHGSRHVCSQRHEKHHQSQSADGRSPGPVETAVVADGSLSDVPGSSPHHPAAEGERGLRTAPGTVGKT